MGNSLQPSVTTAQQMDQSSSETDDELMWEKPPPYELEIGNEDQNVSTKILSEFPPLTHVSLGCTAN